MTGVWNHWLELGGCAAAILVAGSRLARCGDAIAYHTGLGGNWIGLVLMATVTSLPELVTGIASVTVANVPDIAVGNVLGACVLNLAMLVILDVLHRQASIYSVASQGHVLGAAFGIVMLGVVAFGILSAREFDLRIGHAGMASLAVLGLYAVAVRSIYHYERKARADAVSAEKTPSQTLRQAVVRYAAAAASVMTGALVVALVARPQARLLNAVGWTSVLIALVYFVNAWLHFRHGG